MLNAWGYDGAIVNEHHANAYGTMPAPNLIAAQVAARTRDIPIGIVGNAIALHGNPLRVGGRNRDAGCHVRRPDHLRICTRYWL